MIAAALCAANWQEPSAGTATAVTVYRNNALVTREVAVPRGEGPVELIVAPLPSQTIDSSLYAEGSDGLRVLSAKFRRRAVQRDAREEVRAREDEIATLKRETERLQREISVIEQDLQFLQKLENFAGVSLQQLTDKGQLNPEAIIKMSEYVMTTRGKHADSEVSRRQDLQGKTEALEFARNKLDEIASGGGRVETDALVVVDRGPGAAGTVSLHYLVNSASWKPMYRLRAGDDDDPVQVEYLAAITQQTDEEWKDVRLTLSTSEPALNAAPPELLPLEMVVPGDESLDAEPRSMAGMGGMGGGMGGMGVSMEQARAAATQHGQAPNASDLLNQGAAAQQAAELTLGDDGRLPGEAAHDGPSVTFHLPIKLSIATRNDPQLVEVTKITLTPEFFHKTTPVLSPHVYRLAKLTNTSDHVLLKGEATIYVGSDFVGRQELPVVAIGEPFVAGFGVDPQVLISRRLLSKTRAVQGGNQVYTYEFRIGVRNYKSTPVTVQVWDRMPKAKGESAAVTFVSSNRPLSTDLPFERNGKPDGLLRWDLSVPAESAGPKIQDINYTFRLEYARDLPAPMLSSGGLKEEPIGGGMGGMGGGFR
jgi:uncharacterized protein (TIGR02231 family)